jgi:hypothetical protein
MGQKHQVNYVCLFWRGLTAKVKVDLRGLNKQKTTKMEEHAVMYISCEVLEHVTRIRKEEPKIIAVARICPPPAIANKW